MLCTQECCGLHKHENARRAHAMRCPQGAKVEVILFQDVKNLGMQGETVKVAEGYFRNFLKPRGLADVANPSNMKRFEHMKKVQLKLQAEKLAEAQKIAKRLEGVTVTVKAKAGESDRLFGSITQHDIADALIAQGFEVDKKQVEMDEHIKKLGLFTVSVRIHPEVHGKFKVLVERA
jgi:large subunit ribosomal protein L9